MLMEMWSMTMPEARQTIWTTRIHKRLRAGRSSSIARFAAALFAAVAVCSCNGGGNVANHSSPSAAASPQQALARCLNGKHFVVQSRPSGVNGASPGGAAFTLTLYPDQSAAQAASKGRDPKTSSVIENSIVDYGGNPAPGAGMAPLTLSKSELEAIRGCLN